MNVFDTNSGGFINFSIFTFATNFELDIEILISFTVETTIKIWVLTFVLTI